MFLQFDGNGVLYAQLARALKRAILHGQLKAGAALPATRVLAAELGLSRNTVLTAYEMLCAEQLTVARVGSGTFVATPAVLGDRPSIEAQVPAQTRYAARLRALPPLTIRRVAHRLRYDLHYGEPLIDPPLVTAWRRELSQAVGARDWGYPPSIGLRVLRQAISEYLARRRGVVCDADDVVIVSGTQQAVSLLARVLIDEGSVVAIEDPGYELASRALQAHGARLLPVKVDAEGLRVEVLPRGSSVRMVLVTPSHQFPSGAVMSLARRTALLEYAAQRGCWVVEDDYDSEFRHDGVAIPALRSIDVHDRVIYVGSFSKVLFPGLRLGYVVCPRGVRDDLVAAKLHDDLGCGSIEQEALAELMQSGAFDRHLRHASAELRRRRATLLDGLREHCSKHLVVNDSRAGMHVVGWLPGWTSRQLEALAAHAAERGLGLHPIAPHYRRQPAPQGLLLGYAALSAKQLRAATALLGECLGKIADQTA
ncbi:MocR-like pyridoxine biosynthesis transcription factor PdxR [Variovorax saccharolyticus]|uniref:MocR-like pyridoxine biosynthesis transcription factor PdxR n=1 Tax=Variovorax saccharolyticus TaxID=3053516 RepID=UPI0025775D67|nr:PLP-dependent aminotransferase family protein [Variovorax sp. J22R187]MDM0018982.1 PLP-dependent aminotransferase family protein [Variovorax sp. J22R187]